MSNPVPIERLIPNKDDSIDGIRVIFKKEKLDEALAPMLIQTKNL